MVDRAQIRRQQGRRTEVSTAKAKNVQVADTVYKRFPRPHELVFVESLKR